MRSTSSKNRTIRAVKPAAALLATALALALTGCGGSDDNSNSGSKTSGSTSGSSVTLPKLNGQTLEVAAVWTGAEQKNFMKVMDEFKKRTGAKINFVPTGNNTSTFLGTKIQGGKPPDVAFLPQVGVLHQFADKGWLKPLGAEAKAQLDKNFSKGWVDLGAWKGKQYGVYAKAANKSLVWYNTAAFQAAGITSTPKTWKTFLSTAQTLSDAGSPAVSVGGADGWTLTDWFENVYLSQAGPQKYDQLAAHKIKWTDPSVKQALTTLAQLWGKNDLLAGGNKGALNTEFPKSVTQTFSGDNPAAMVFEGDFVAANINGDTKAKMGTDAKVFPFPSVGANPPVVSGGDVAVALKDGKGPQALLTFLASTDAAQIWAAQGGILSPNKEMDMSSYKDAITKQIAQALLAAGDNFRFDMSDQAPAAFGGTAGVGEWKDLQDFLRNPKDIAGTQQKLETDAAKAYATG
ncbi:ABC transporter substrate-binding protein [Streptomyces spinosirectus]|jgi:multiple sugar transport system substrate-binding protein/alpha-glucoside transport system substrate-binding protein|uniref:ABC transporter substrate-binding protein n=1 Tax=Streptomyces TaxID=1883 RepID=UPI000FFE3AAF|nr:MULTISPECIES: ABC transporter substrate-binding protein [Streptomyces]MBY8345673.1 carbohydrate ABC transporter substrate-binding protein [Streptomyces plumbidurans]UIR20062.1 ABC transporter substrate-binding protein [Streptomyces spinosirectus]